MPAAAGRASKLAAGACRTGPCATGPRAPHARRLAPGQQILDPADDDLRLERLHQHAVAADRARARLVDRLERAGQQHDGDVRERGVALDERGHFVAVAFRHPDVGEDDVGTIALHGSIAACPFPTAMTWTSSSANVSSMTRWIVTLSSASRSLCGMAYHDTLSGHSRMVPLRPPPAPSWITLLDAALIVIAPARPS